MKKKKNKKVDFTKNLLINKEINAYDENISDGLTASEFRSVLVDYLLSENFYISDPVGCNQGNYIIADYILSQYSKRYRRERVAYEKHLKKQRKIRNKINELERKLK